MRENNGTRTLACRLVLLLSKPAAENRLNFKCLKRTVRNSNRAHACWLAAMSQRYVSFLPNADVGERSILIAIREIHGRCGGQIVEVNAWSTVSNPHEIACVRI